MQNELSLLLKIIASLKLIQNVVYKRLTLAAKTCNYAIMVGSLLRHLI